VAGKEPDTGATSQTVADNVRRLRDDQNMNFTQLSERLQTAAGWSINAVGIRRIEAGERRVTPDDLVALALALGVSPSTLLMPAQDSEGNPIEAEVEVEATGFAMPVAARTFWEWLIGAGALDDNFAVFFERSLPVWVFRSWRDRVRKISEDLYRDVPGGVPPERRAIWDNGDD
jgi:transcriptional regulator with XRE-family HTH domain